MRDWQLERRRRTRHLIELGGLVIKSGLVELTGDDRAVIYGALLWAADKLQRARGDYALGLWGEKVRDTFGEERGPRKSAGVADSGSDQT